MHEKKLLRGFKKIRRKLIQNWVFNNSGVPIKNLYQVTSLSSWEPPSPEGMSSLPASASREGLRFHGKVLPPLTECSLSNILSILKDPTCVNSIGEEKKAGSRKGSFQKLARNWKAEIEKAKENSLGKPWKLRKYPNPALHYQNGKCRRYSLRGNSSNLALFLLNTLMWVCLDGCLGS